MIICLSACSLVHKQQQSFGDLNLRFKIDIIIIIIIRTTRRITIHYHPLLVEHVRFAVVDSRYRVVGTLPPSSQYHPPRNIRQAFVHSSSLPLGHNSCFVCLVGARENNKGFGSRHLLWCLRMQRVVVINKPSNSRLTRHHLNTIHHIHRPITN